MLFHWCISHFIVPFASSLKRISWWCTDVHIIRIYPYTQQTRSNLSSEQNRAVCLSLWSLSLWNRGELWWCLSSRMDKWRSTWRCVHSELAKSSKLCRSSGWDHGELKALNRLEMEHGICHPEHLHFCPVGIFEPLQYPPYQIYTWGVGRNPVVDTWVCLKIWYTERAINTKMMINQMFFFRKIHFKVTQ